MCSKVKGFTETESLPNYIYDNRKIYGNIYNLFIDKKIPIFSVTSRAHQPKQRLILNCSLEKYEFQKTIIFNYNKKQLLKNMILKKIIIIRKPAIKTGFNY